MQTISIIIPAFNEEKRIKKTLDAIIKYLNVKKFDYEIIVVDDGSKDNTVKIVKSFTDKKVRYLSNKVNQGKGASVRKGILAATKELVLFSDSDLATPIEELTNFLGLIDKGHDIVIGSRNLKDSDVKVEQPKYRELLGKAFPFLVNIITIGGFKDTQCGFKLFRINAAQKIANLQTLNRFSFDVEMLFIAKKLGLKIKEVPVIWMDQKESKVNPLKDAPKMLLDLFKIRYNDLIGKYGR